MLTNDRVTVAVLPVFAWFAPPTSFEVQVLLVVIWLGGVIGGAEGLKRRTRVDAEVNRKIIHIGVGNVILLAWWFQLPTWVGVAASVVFSGVTLLAYRYPLLASLAGSDRNSWGTVFYAVSIGVLIAGFWPLGIPQYAVIGVLVMTWGDGLAALIGQRWGQHPYTLWGLTKSWEGSLTMAVTSGICIALVLGGTQGWSWQTGVSAIAIALIAAGLESLSKYGIDNLTVPLGTALLCYGFNELWF